MHGQEETSKVPRLVWAVAHLGVVGTAAWILFGNGIATIGGWFGKEWGPADPTRSAILVGFGVILWLRMTITAFYLLERKFGWDESISVIGAVAFYQIGFAICGGVHALPVGALEYAGIAVFLLGSYFNTGSEMQRKKFKEDPANKGKLYTKGLFGLVRHPNYLGDSLWAAGWAMVTHNVWAAIMPVLATLAFLFAFIPQLSKYLEGKYGDQYRDWSKKTARFFPYIY